MQQSALEVPALPVREIAGAERLPEMMREVLNEILGAEETKSMYLALRASGSSVLEAIETVLRFDQF